MAIYINQDPRVTSISTGASAATIGRRLREPFVLCSWFQRTLLLIYRLCVHSVSARLIWSGAGPNKKREQERTQILKQEMKQRRRLARPPAEYVWPSNLLRQLRI